MKAILFVCCLTVSFGAIAQQKNEKPYKSFYEIITSKPLSGKIEFKIPAISSNEKSAFEVRKLPLDNMSCLVPDITVFNMPVAGKGESIPNTMPVLRKILPVK